MGLFLLRVDCFMGSVSGSLISCPSNEIALCLTVCDRVSIFVIFPLFAVAFSAASGTDLLVADLSMCEGGMPSIRRSPLCWDASSQP